MKTKAYIIQAAIPNSGLDHTLYRTIDGYSFENLPSDVLADIDKLAESWWRCFETYHRLQPFCSNSVIVLNFFAEGRRAHTVEIAHNTLNDFIKSLGLINTKILINLSDLDLDTYHSLKHLDVIYTPYQMRSYYTIQDGIREIKRTHDVNQNKILYLTGRIDNNVRLYTLWKLLSSNQSQNIKHSFAMPDPDIDPDYWHKATAHLNRLTGMDSASAIDWLEKSINYLDLQAQDFYNPRGFQLDLISGKHFSSHCGGTARAPGGRTVDLTVYNDCLMQLIVESSILNFTEKTWNAISNCMPFVHINTSENTQNYYADQGYEPFVDYEYPTRDLHKLADLNIQKALELFQQKGNPVLQDKALHNQNLFFSQCEKKVQEIRSQLGSDVFEQLQDHLFFQNGYSNSITLTN